MNGIYPVADVRAAEQALMATLPDGVLMQRAARALAVQCARLLGRVYGTRVVLLVGTGDNGGDALYAGAELADRGARVTAIRLGERVHEGGLARLLATGGRTVPAWGADESLAGALAAIGAADLVVDGIVGIGARAGLREPAGHLAAAATDVLTVAVDIPSGVNADTGAVAPRAKGGPPTAVRADCTVVMGALKPGVVSGAGVAYAGELRVADIGLGPHLVRARAHVLDGVDVAAALPQPGADDDKYTRGVVGVVAGSEQYPGAGVLSTGSALSGGSGMVRYLGLAPEEIRARYPQVVVQSGARPGDVQVQAWVVGPGLGLDDEAVSLLAEVLASDRPVIVDADAITLVAARPALVRRRAAPTVLTPHDREFTRLGLELGADRLEAARRGAAELGVTMLLKGDATVVAAPDGTAYVNRTGTPWLATAGSGDVLSGLIGSLLAAGLEPALAAAVGAHVHGVAGQLAALEGPPSAADVLDMIRPAIGRIGPGSAA